MKMKLYRKDFHIWIWELYLLPTIKIITNNPMYDEKNISLEFHFLFIHTRLLWFEE